MPRNLEPSRAGYG